MQISYITCLIFFLLYLNLENKTLFIIIPGFHTLNTAIQWNSLLVKVNKTYGFKNSTQNKRRKIRK